MAGTTADSVAGVAVIGMSAEAASAPLTGADGALTGGEAAGDYTDDYMYITSTGGGGYPS